MKQRRVPPELTPGRRRFLRLGAAVFWIAVWQLAAMFIHQEILLASPVSVAARLISLLPEPSFWRAQGENKTIMVQNKFNIQGLQLLYYKNTQVLGKGLLQLLYDIH